VNSNHFPCAWAQAMQGDGSLFAFGNGLAEPVENPVDLRAVDRGGVEGACLRATPKHPGIGGSSVRRTLRGLFRSRPNAVLFRSPSATSCFARLCREWARPADLRGQSRRFSFPGTLASLGTELAHSVHEDLFVKDDACQRDSINRTLLGIPGFGLASSSRERGT